MTTQLRCKANLYAVLSDDHKSIEVRCKRRACGAEPGVIVLHTLSLETGQVIDTRRFKDPASRKG